MLDAAADLPGTGVVGAKRGGLVLAPHEPGSALGALRGESPRRPVVGAVGQHRAQHLGDDVAGLADHDGVAGAHVLDGHLVGVVEGGGGDRGATHEHGFEPGERGGLTAGSDRHLDVEQRGVALLGRHLVGDRPAGCPGREAQFALQDQVVDLDHDAIDLVVEVVADRLDGLHVLEHGGEVVEALGSVVDRKAQAAQPFEGVEVRTVVGTTDHLPHLVHPERQVARRGDGGILLAQGAGGGVAGVDVGLLAGGLLGGVEGREGGQPQVDLAAHLEHGRGTVSQPLGHVVDGADVGGDVLADPTVAAGGGLHEPTVLIAQRHREPVELELAGPGRRRGFLAEAPQHPL